MANNSKVIDAGAVTAYGAAVAGGYQGTYEQWCAGMADFGKSVSEVAQKAQEVSTNAAAVEEARQEVEENKEIVDDAMAGIQAAKADALSAIGESKTDALHDIVEEGTDQYYSVQNAGTAQLNSINAAATSTLASISSAGAAQVEAIEAEGNEQYGRATEEADRAEEQAELAGNSATAASEAAQTATNMAEDASASEELASQHAAAAAASAEAAANASALEVKTITDVPIASFSDGADEIPIKGMTVNVDPVQDLHGQANPYPAGGGANKFGFKEWLDSVGATYTQSGDSITINTGGQTPALYGSPFVFSDTDIQVTMSVGSFTMNSGSAIRFELLDSSNNVVGNYFSTAAVPQTVTASKIRMNWSGGGKVVLKNVMLNAGATALPYAPYENNCPITGWTGAKIIKAGENLLSSDKYVIGANSVRIGTSTNVADIMLKQGVYSLYVKYTTQVSVYIGHYDDAYSDYVRLGNTNTKILINITKPTDVIGLYVYSGGGVNPDSIESYLQVGNVTPEQIPSEVTTYSLTFPSAAGTVYGAKLINEGTETWKLRVNYKSIDLATLNWSKTSAFYATVSDIQPLSNGWCSIFPVANANQPAPSGINILIRGDTTIYVRNIAGTIYENMTPQEFAAAMNGVQFVYCIATTVEYTITGEVVETLLGLNNIWADTGNIAELKYRAMFNTNLIKALIAPVLPSMVADTALAVNDFRIVGDNLYRITSPIASGGTLTPNTNCTVTNVAEVLKSLLS